MGRPFLSYDTRGGTGTTLKMLDSIGVYMMVNRDLDDLQSLEVRDVAPEVAPSRFPLAPAVAKIAVCASGSRRGNRPAQQFLCRGDVAFDL